MPVHRLRKKWGELEVLKKVYEGNSFTEVLGINYQERNDSGQLCSWNFSDFILQNYWVLLFYIMMHFEILSPLVLHHFILFLSPLCVTLARSSNIEKERHWFGSQSLARICWFHDGCSQHWHKATDKFSQVQMMYLYQNLL